MQQSSECDVARKQSASDLQSRLKTRKLLGVGELVGDNGDIYRSKVSFLNLFAIFVMANLVYSF